MVAVSRSYAFSSLAITAEYSGNAVNTMSYLIGIKVVILALAIALFVVFSEGR